MDNAKIDVIVKRGHEKLERFYAAEVGEPGEPRSSYDPTMSHYKITAHSKHEKTE